MGKITYLDKVDSLINPNPIQNKVIGVEMNMIKESVNALYDFENVTYLQLSTLLSTNKIDPGRFYKITNRGDSGIILQGLTKKTVTEHGLRIMLCPKKTVYVYDPTTPYAGVWRNYKGKYSFNGLSGGTFTAGKIIDNGTTWGVIDTVGADYITFKKIVGSPFSIADTFTEYNTHGGSTTGVTATSSSNPFISGESFCIWAGHVYVSATGKAGTRISDIELSNDWLLVSKTGTEFPVYEEVMLHVGYDFANNFIYAQWDNNGNKAGIPLVMFNALGGVTNPVDVCDWNIGAYNVFIRNIEAFFGFYNNCPLPDSGDIITWSNIRAGTFIENDCEGVQNVICNGDFDPSVSDADAFGLIQHNRCKVISDIYQTGGIRKIPDTVKFYSYHTDDESFYIHIDCTIDPLLVGTYKVNCIQKEGSRLIEYTILGNNLTAPGGSASISSGLDIDHPDFIQSTPIATINNGVKAAGISAKTTDDARELIINVAGNDITGGTLTIIGKYA